MNQSQLATLQAVIDQLIPEDEFPGGWEAGVGTFIERLLAGDAHALAETYEQGLDAIEAEAQARHTTPFAALPAEAQHELLAAIERGQVATPWPTDPATFFQIVAEHAAEGYYSDPGQGGNRDAVAWRMIGFEVRG